MKSIIERLQKGEILLSDGATGTELFKKGGEPGGCLELLNLTNRAAVGEVIKSYLDAGSEIVLTNTLGGSPLKLVNYNLEDKAEAINNAAVKIAKETVGSNAYIAASIGPSGRILKPYGDVEPEALKESFARQLKAVIDAGTDLICIETMIDLHEAVIAVKTAKEVSPRIPVIATMTFNFTPKGFYTIMGNNIPDVVKELMQAGVDIIGSNCGNGLENMIKIAREFKNLTKLPIIIQSNAGMPENKNGQLIFPETPQFFASKVPELIDAGVSIIGGCCGTTPEYIAAIRYALDSR